MNAIGDGVTVQRAGVKDTKDQQDEGAGGHVLSWHRLTRHSLSLISEFRQDLFWTRRCGSTANDFQEGFRGMTKSAARRVGEADLPLDLELFDAHLAERTLLYFLLHAHFRQK